MAGTRNHRPQYDSIAEIVADLESPIGTLGLDEAEQQIKTLMLKILEDEYFGVCQDCTCLTAIYIRGRILEQ